MNTAHGLRRSEGHAKGTFVRNDGCPLFPFPFSLPDEGGPAILEVSVPAWVMAILYADPIAAGLARSGEVRFEPESGLNELRVEWPNLTKRVIPL